MQLKPQGKIVPIIIQYVTKITKSHSGISIVIKKNSLFNIHFADDQAITAQYSCWMEFMLTRFDKVYEMWKLNINPVKTEYLGVKSNKLIKEQVNKFNYLGVINN